MSQGMTSAVDIIHESGIGASEIAAVVGISPWADPWTVYARKMKPPLIGPQEQTEEMSWGKILEPVIADVFSMRMGLPIEWWDKRVYSHKRPWQYASPDAFVFPGPDAPKQILECKTAGLHQSGEWDRDSGGKDGVPEYYVAQVEWQMSVCELEVAWIAVLIAGNDFRIYRIEHDPVREEILLEAGETFWREHIMSQVEPPIGGSERARAYLRQHFPREREKIRPATAEEAEWLNQYAELRHLLDRGDERRKELENRITQAIGDHEGLEWQGGKFTWKHAKGRTLTSWEKLAKSQMVRFSEQEQKNLIEQYTHTEAGSRRIHFSAKVAR